MNGQSKISSDTVNFCKDIFKCSPSEKRLLIWLIIVIIFSAGATYFKFQNIIPKVEKNSADIETLKFDFREITTKQTLMHDDIKEVQKDIKLLLRK